jgi:hypothetical protein
LHSFFRPAAAGQEQHPQKQAPIANHSTLLNLCLLLKKQNNLQSISAAGAALLLI